MNDSLRKTGFRRWTDEQVRAFDELVTYFATHPTPVNQYHPQRKPVCREEASAVEKERKQA